MTVLMVRSERNDLLQPLLTSAIAAKLRVLEIALRQTERRLTAFEHQHQMSTRDFVARYPRNEMAATLDSHRMAWRVPDGPEYPRRDGHVEGAAVW